VVNRRLVAIHQNLKPAFYETFDPSVIMSFLQKLAPLSESQRRQIDGFLGEGMHFQSFGLATTPLELAVSVAKETFTGKGDLAIDHWRDAVNQARKIEGDTLVPPMEILQHMGLTALVMPKGRQMSKDFCALTDIRLQETSKALGGAGLVLDDYPQLREAQGVPFIIDWSDLKFSKPSYR
jgi:hypothetical protein